MRPEMSLRNEGGVFGGLCSALPPQACLHILFMWWASRCRSGSAAPWFSPDGYSAVRYYERAENSISVIQ